MRWGTLTSLREGIREKEFKVVNRVLGLLLLAIGVQFIITGIKAAF